MAGRNRQGKPPVERTVQNTQNWSFDNEFKVQATELLGYTALEGTPSIVRLAAVESADYPGVYGLLVLNADGTAVSTGGGATATTYKILLETGDTLLMETGDALRKE